MTGPRRRSTQDAGTRQASRVLFVAGFLTFTMIYVAQGLLPAVSADFGVSPASASLTLSLTTLPLAVALVVAASWSEGHGRRGLVVAALLGGGALTLAGAASPNFPTLLAVRILTGLALAGLPAVAMAYVAEEVPSGSLGRAMGLYISGTGLGGMAGRLTGGLLGGALSWRWALAAVGLTGLLGGLWVARRLPSSRNFRPDPVGLPGRLRALRTPLRDPVLLGLAACGFVLMGCVVSFYNYLQYRLARPPFDLEPSVVALVFLLYLFGTVGANYLGRATDRRGRRSVLQVGLAVMVGGALLSLPDNLALVLVGAAALTFGFFGSHAVASGWVGGLSSRGRAQTSALYLFAYHVGSAVVGFVGGILYGEHGWAGEVATVLVLLAVAVLVTLRLPRAAGHTEPPVAA